MSVEKILEDPERVLYLLKDIRQRARHTYEFSGDYEAGCLETIFKDIDQLIGPPGPAPGDADDFIPPDEVSF